MTNKLLECPKCGWVHFGVTEEYVRAWEAEWAELCRTKPVEWLENYGLQDRVPPSRDKYEKCFRCGTSHKAGFFETKKTLDGHTIQPILEV